MKTCTPSSPNNGAKRFMDVYLFPALKRVKGEAILHKGREQNLHQEKRLVIFLCLNNFCPWLQVQQKTSIKQVMSNCWWNALDIRYIHNELDQIRLPTALILKFQCYKNCSPGVLLWSSSFVDLRFFANCTNLGILQSTGTEKENLIQIICRNKVK